MFRYFIKSYSILNILNILTDGHVLKFVFKLIMTFIRTRLYFIIYIFPFSYLCMLEYCSYFSLYIYSILCYYFVCVEKQIKQTKQTQLDKASILLPYLLLDDPSENH